MNKALTVKADPRTESGSESGTEPDLSPSGGEPFRLAIGKSFSRQWRLQDLVQFSARPMYLINMTQLLSENMHAGFATTDNEPSNPYCLHLENYIMMEIFH